MQSRWNGQKGEWTYYFETAVSGHAKSLGQERRPTSVLRDRVTASFTEQQDWETEQDGVDISFDMDSALEGN